MSLSVRSFFRSHRSRNKNEHVQQRSSSSSMIVSPPSFAQLPMIKEETLTTESVVVSNDQQWFVPVDFPEYAVNLSCCGGDEKKNSIKNPVKTARAVKEAVGHTKALANPMEASDHKITTVTQQKQTPKVDIDDDLKDLFGKRELTKAMINQLAQRAMAGSMNANNDDPPRLCTKKHV